MIQNDTAKAVFKLLGDLTQVVEINGEIVVVQMGKELVGINLNLGNMLTMSLPVTLAK